MTAVTGLAPVFPPPPAHRARGRVYDSHETVRWFMQHVREVEGTVGVSRPGASPQALPGRHADLLQGQIVHGGRRISAGAALAAAGADALVVVHRGVLVTEEYFGAMTASTPHMWQSMTKLLVGLVTGAMIERGLLSPQQLVSDLVPEVTGSAYGDARVRDLLDMTVGLVCSEDYEDENSDVSRLDRLYGVRPPLRPGEPGSSYEEATIARKDSDHGSEFRYASLNTQVLGWVLERSSGRSVPDLVEDVVWSRIGGEHEAYLALDGAGSAQSEGGFCSSARDLARFGLLLRQGAVGSDVVVSRAWLDDTRTNARRDLFARSVFGDLFPGGGYRNCVWSWGDGFEGSLVALGIYGQLLYVDPATDLVIAKFATWPHPFDPGLAQLDRSIVLAITRALS